jgi:hypothetical protein
MKKALLTTLALAAVTSAFAQGTVVFNNNTGSGSSRVYAPEVGEPAQYTQKTGNTATQNPSGTQTYTGALLSGNGWTAQLFAIPGNTLPSGPFTPYGVPLTDNFVGGSPTTTFRTGTGAGVVAATTATLGNITPDAASAVLQMRVFPSSFGNWAAAVAAFNAQNPLALIGASQSFIVANIGGSVNTPPNLTGLQSFSLVAPPAVPEPSSFALAGMGLASLLIFRRRK